MAVKIAVISVSGAEQQAGLVKRRRPGVLYWEIATVGDYLAKRR
jgi:hypothetical protein